MTGPAELSVFHLLHGHAVHTSFGFEQVGMTFPAAEDLDMVGMRKGDVARFLILKEDVACMTFRAVTGHVESFFAVMTEAAGLPLLHCLHTDMVAVILLLEYLWMTCFTLKPAAMHTMVEYDPTDGLRLDGHLGNHGPHAHTTHFSHADCIQTGR